MDKNTRFETPARRPVRRFLLLSALCACVLLPALPAGSPDARAQPAISPLPEPAIARPVPPRLRLVAAEARLPIEVVRVRVEAEVVGLAARTRIEMEFRNPNDRVLEGELQFPLRPGQSVTGFALDIDGELRPAVPVEKARGRQVFEDVIRTRVDPALLEVTEGNNYRLRVYPLPANGTRRVVLEIGETLSRTAEGGSSRADPRLDYQLPLQFGQPIARLDIDLQFAGVDPRTIDARLGAQRVAATASGNGGARLAFDRTSMRDPHLRVLLPVGDNRVHVSTQARGSETYFYAEVPVAAVGRARAAPSQIAIVWDASGSGAARDHARELAVLDAYLRSLGRVVVHLVEVRDVAAAPRRFEVSGADWRELRSTLEKTVYDGATNLGAVAVPEGVTLALLFSDGLGNFGPDPLPALPVPTYALMASAVGDPVALRHAAEASGASLIDLQRMAPADVVRELRTQRTRVVAARAEGATDLVQAGAYPDDGRFVFAGRMLAPQATIELDVIAPDGTRSVRRVRVQGSSDVMSGAVTGAMTEVASDTAAAPRFAGLAAQRWAALRLAGLLVDGERNRAEIRRLGTRFAMPTPETSLIVLDAVADYARHGIEPPPSLKPAYERLVARLRDTEVAARSRHLDRIAARFSEEQAWWERVFPKDEPPKPAANTSSGATGAAGAAVGSARSDDAARRPDRPSPAAAPPSVSRPLAAPPKAAPAATSVAAGPGDKAAGATAPAAPAAIRLSRWVPDAPYAKRLRAAADDALYGIYLDERPSYLTSTAFFLDVADLLFERGQPALAQRVLSNLAEMDLGNRQVLRILAYRLLQARQVPLALPVLRKVLVLSPDEPQSYRDLGLALAQSGQPQQAIDQLWQVVSRPWNNRFPDIELIALAELNALVARTAAAGGPPLDTQAVDARLLRNLPLDLRVVLSWDADNTDIDLWVIDPNGDRAYYGRRLTWQGGRMSNDFTGGYGPEAFSLRDAKPGTYVVKAQFFGHNQQIVAPATTLMMRLSTSFGRPGQTDEDVVLRLSGRRQEVTVGTFVVGKPESR